MQIVTRQEAIARRLSRYFTGKPCKNGHISERYTRISACIGCMRPSFEAVDIQERRDARERLSGVLASLTKIHIRLHPNDLEIFESSLLASAIVRNSSLRLKHLQTRGKPKPWSSGMFRHTFLCFPDDMSDLRAFQDTLESARNLQWLPSMKPLSPQERSDAINAAALAEHRIPEFRP